MFVQGRSRVKTEKVDLSKTCGAPYKYSGCGATFFGLYAWCHFITKIITWLLIER